MSVLQTRLSFPVKKRPTRTSNIKSKKLIDPEDDDVIINTENIFKSPLTPRKTKSTAVADNCCSVTPPKQRRTLTPDSRDNRENIQLSPPKTPSTLLAKLDLNSVLCDDENTINEKQSRKKLFDDNNEKYNNARRALHSTVPVNMPARSEEIQKLQNFINDHLEHKTSGTMYISGPPGTGKTAALTKILAEFEDTVKFKDVYINCTSIKSATSVYSNIAKELGIKCTGRSEKTYLAAIEKYLVTNHKPIILVLDEIDQLDTRKQQVLYTIFEWPAVPHSKLILIGIANALDLTDRILPRLQARCELKPKLMHFASYTKQQIVEIITDRLNAAGVSEVFSPVAVQMLAGKVAAVSGDIRRALDIARRVIELVVTEERQSRVLQPTERVNERLEENEVFKTVNIDKVATVLNDIYGTSQNLQDDVDESVPLQQKLLLCSLILMLKKGKNKDVTIGKLHEVYRRVCTKRNMAAIDQSEVVGLLSLLETRGMIKVIGRKEPRLNKVSLEWDEDEVSDILRDKRMMSSVLQDVSVLTGR